MENILLGSAETGKKKTERLKKGRKFHCPVRRSPFSLIFFLIGSFTRRLCSRRCLGRFFFFACMCVLM